MGLLDELAKRFSGKVQNGVTNAAHKVKSEINNGINNAAKKIEHEASIKHKKVKLEKLPQNVEEMKAMSAYDQKDEYAVAAMTIAALLRYASDKKDGREMLDVLDGPESPAVRDLQLMDEKLRDGDYVIRSYFKGAEPDNDYKPSEPYTVRILEYKNSRDQENYLYLYVESGGADNPRPIQLRRKPSTGEWFVWQFQSLLADIRVPVSEDKWA